MSLENIKSSIKKLKNASLENCLRQMLDKMETQEETISQLQREVRKKDSKLEEMRCEIEELQERVGQQEQILPKTPSLSIIYLFMMSTYHCWVMY